MNKYYISYNEIHDIIQKLSKKILKDFKPDIIIAITGGGLIPSRIIRTYLKCDILCIGVKLYDEYTNTHHGNIQTYQWFNEDFKELENKNVLIIDEVDDTRTTLTYVIEELNKFKPKQLAVGVIHNKLKQKKNEIPKYCKYYAGENIPDKWIVYPWETTNINEHQQNCIKYKTD